MYAQRMASREMLLMNALDSIPMAIFFCAHFCSMVSTASLSQVAHGDANVKGGDAREDAWKIAQIDCG